MQDGASWRRRKRPVKTVASYGRFRENGREVGMTGGGVVSRQSAFRDFLAKSDCRSTLGRRSPKNLRLRSLIARELLESGFASQTIARSFARPHILEPFSLEQIHCSTLEIDWT